CWYVLFAIRGHYRMARVLHFRFEAAPRFEYENEQILAETDSMNSCVYRSALFRFVDRPL
ncbi:hypothetical protein, partial [Burkholderia ubonensis]|uniref:hypothetical protein n=1 Tax=Burkholderia ubonensis TaxID=101571 RepID=UPI001E3ADF31